MTAHKHAGLIKAKVDDMDLVVFFKNGTTWKKTDSRNVLPAVNSPHVEYFICHPKHADVCLHWLNGGEAQKYQTPSQPPYYWDECLISRAWSKNHDFMQPDGDFRIKPRKEKRWVVVKNGTLISNRIFVSKHEAEVMLGRRASCDAQFIEIEVEV